MSKKGFAIAKVYPGKLNSMVKIMMKNRVQVHGGLLKKHPDMKTRRPLDLFHFSGEEGK